MAHVEHAPINAIALMIAVSIKRCLAKERGERAHDIVVILAALEALAVAHPWTQRDAATWWAGAEVRAMS